MTDPSVPALPLDGGEVPRYRILHCNDMGEDYMSRCWIEAECQSPPGTIKRAGGVEWVRAEDHDRLVDAHVQVIAQLRAEIAGLTAVHVGGDGAAVGSCLLCGQRREFATWQWVGRDRAVGLCLECRDAPQGLAACIRARDEAWQERDDLKELESETAAELEDAQQQLEVLKPGGSYAWKSKYDALQAAVTQLVAQWRAHADELRPLSRAVTTVAAIGWLAQCAGELEAALVVPHGSQLRENKDDLARGDKGIGRRSTGSTASTD